MVDIHTHVLPQVDDGARNIEESMEMFQIFKNNQIDHVIATPHANIGDVKQQIKKEEILQQVVFLQKQINEAGLPVKVYPGMEVFATFDLEDRLADDCLLSLNLSKYLLIEFPFEADENFCFEALRTVTKWNYIPVIAHPERYDIVQEYPEIVYEWNRCGYIIQLNQGSVQGEFGEKERYTAETLLVHNLVQVIASDCHNTRYRRADLIGVFHYIENKYSKGYAEILLNINPQRILENREVLIINPLKP